jgi:Zn-dependent protease/predicted transcriptional regulator
MRWSWKLTRIAGIDVYVHATFFILIAWLALSYWMVAGTLSAVLTGVGFILALFICIVLHELGHALTARRYGIQTRHITLLPIGGIAALERMPSDPRQEIRVALAGPAVNIMIALILWVWLWMNNAWVPPGQLGLTEGPFVERLMIVNLFLAGFNLLPAFPMDGGRVLRAALAMRMSYVDATRTAASLGQGLALWMGLLGLLYNPFLLFIALFVWIGAAAEAGAVQIKSTLATIPVHRAMLTDFYTLSSSDSLAQAVDLTLAGSQKDFPVMTDTVMAGVLTQADLLIGLRTHGEQAQVGQFMQREFQTADIDEPLETLLERLQSCACRMVPILQSGKLVGIVNLDNIHELLQIQAALHDQGEPGSGKKSF